MSNDLRVTLVQGATRWHDPAGNREYYGGLIAGLKQQTDLIILPETFTSGFSNEALANAEDMHGQTIAWIRQHARQLDSAITGSVQIKTVNGVFNRLLFAMPDGEIHTYDKRHLFRMANEHERYAAGKDRLIVTWRDWRICPLVCYDLRFPVFARNRFDKATDTLDYDLLLFVANWPTPRRQPWRTLLRARAIENLAYVAAVNRVGVDGNDIGYSGDSAVIDMIGEAMIDCGAQEQVVTALLSKDALNAFRQRFPAYQDADRFDWID